MNCLAAEVACQSALIGASRIDAMRQTAAAKSAVADATGGEKVAVADDELDKIRTDATNQLAESLKFYDQAANLIGKASTKLGEGQTLAGKNYVWQVQVGQAAVNMLQAILLADKPDEAAGAREKAYKLLTDAAKTREQSPLLAPAIDALVHLQQTAR